MWPSAKNPLNRPKNLTDVIQEFFILFALFLFILFALAIFGLFQCSLVVFLVVIFLGIILFRLYYLYAFRSVLIARWTKGVLVFILLVTLFNAVFHHDVPQSRDNIGYLTAARMLAKNGTLHFQDIISRPYHPYRAINLGPDVFTSQFLPGYNAFLGLWFQLYGLPLVFWGNLILFFFFLVCFYGASLSVLPRKWAFFALACLVTFYAFLWFPRRTNSENLTMCLLWLGIWLFLSGVKKTKLRHALWSLLPISLMVLVRGEGLLYLGIFLLACFVLILKKRKQIKQEKLIFLPLLFVLFNAYLFFHYVQVYQGVYILQHGLSLFYTIRDFFRVPFMVVILVIGFIFLGLLAFGLRRFLQQANWRPARKGQIVLFVLICVFLLIDFAVIYYHHHYKELINWQIYRTQYVFIVLGQYFLMPYFVLFLLGLLGSKRIPRNLWYIAFLILPNVVFFLDPFVGLDQPWFLRRFYPAVIPFLFLAAAWGIQNLPLAKKHLVSVCGLLLLANLWVSQPIIFFVENQGMRSQLLDFAEHFEQDSLILMDPGWHWQQWAYALHYLYDYDVLPKLDNFSEEELEVLVASYEHVYVVSKNQEDIFGSRLIADDQLTYLFAYEFKYPTIAPTMQLTQHVMENEDQVQMRRLLVAYRTLLPRQRDWVSDQLYVYSFAPQMMVKK